MTVLLETWRIITDWLLRWQLFLCVVNDDRQKLNEEKWNGNNSIVYLAQWVLATLHNYAYRKILRTFENYTAAAPQKQPVWRRVSRCHFWAWSRDAFDDDVMWSCKACHWLSISSFCWIIWVSSRIIHDAMTSQSQTRWCSIKLMYVSVCLDLFIYY